MTVRALLTTVLVSLTLAACTGGVVSSDFRSVDPAGWHQDSLCVLQPDITDTITPMQVVLYVRHVETYPYQNLWLFITTPDITDTIEFYLADDRGRWLGNGGNGYIEMPVLLEEHYRFARQGACTFTVQHGMRDTLLRGITDIGIEIRNGKE